MATEDVIIIDTDERAKNRPLDGICESLRKDVSRLVVRADVSQMNTVASDDFRHPMEVNSVSSCEVA